MKKTFVKFAVFAILVAPLAVALPAGAAMPNWDVTGGYTMDVLYLGSHYNYALTLDQTGATITGDLYDQYLPGHLAVSGIVSGNDVTFSVTYPSNWQGTRTFTGTIDASGVLSGSWNETGAEQGSDAWSTTSGTATAIAITCPAGTTQSSSPLEIVTVPSNSSVVTPSSNSLLNGGSYLLVSSGAWRNGSLNVADTEYASTDNWATHMDGYNIAPYFLGEGEFDLRVDSAFVDWGNYNPTHSYSYLYTGTGNPVSFLVFDGYSNPPPVLEPGWYGDNSGSLTVNVYSCNPIVQTYTLTYTAGAHGSITGTSPQTVNSGDSGTAVTAVPASDYHFVSWSDGVLTASRTDTNVQADIDVTASFAINTYTLTYTAGENGSIGGVSPQTVDYGSNGSAVTAVPANGYHFVSWSDASVVNPRTDTNVTVNISVTANFAIDTHTITVTQGANGTIAPDPAVVNYGANQAFTITPDAHYHIADVLVDGSSVSAVTTYTFINVTVNHTITASFAVNSPIDKDQCKKDGWQSLYHPDGSLFKNQGDCVSFVASENGQNQSGR